MEIWGEEWGGEADGWGVGRMMESIGKEDVEGKANEFLGNGGSRL